MSGSRGCSSLRLANSFTERRTPWGKASRYRGFCRASATDGRRTRCRDGASALKPVVLVTYAPDGEKRRAIADIVGDAAEVRFWPDHEESSKDGILGRTRVVLTYDPFEDLGIAAIRRLENCELIQCLTAGVDYLPLRSLPEHIPVACNAGAYAEPMAEHVIAMALSAAKRLAREHALMREGEFNQFKSTKRFAGLTCGILGYGATGREVARLMRALGVRIQAVNRSGHTDESVEFIGTLDDLDRVLAVSDILVITLSLTPKTNALIGAERLALMKPDAILVNVARGEIVEQEALYRHLASNPGFTACIESWWIEPIRHGRFEIDYPFLELPNVIASPHNSAMTHGMTLEAVRRGAKNVRRLLDGETPLHVVGESDKLN